MDATSAVITLIFVITIISSFGSRGYKPPVILPPNSPEVITLNNSAPDPSCGAATAEASFSSIEKYVMKYRSNEEAHVITNNIIKYAGQYNVNPKLVASLMARESRFNPRALSSSGAVGLGQLLPSTCKTVGVTDPYDIEQNAMGTIRYFKYLLDRFSPYPGKVSLAIAGYLEGPNLVEKNLSYSPHAAQYISDIYDIYNKM